MAKQSKGFIQLEWTCPNCTSKNPGPVKTCQNCGAPQPENVKFERAAEDKFVTDENQIKAAQAGADIHCGFCGTRNPANAQTCSQCGGDLKEGKAREAGRVLEASPAQPKIIKCTNCETENPGTNVNCSKCGAPLPRAAKPAAPQPLQVKASANLKPTAPKKTNWLLIGGIALFLLCCVGIAFMAFVIPTSSVQGIVSNVYWETSVPVQEIQAVNYSNERGSPPSAAYNVSCRTESEQVCEDKTIDKGNGFAEVVTECHNESNEYCSYTVDEWTTIQTYKLDGTDLSPLYSDPALASDQRLGDSSQTLTVYFDTENGQETYTASDINEFQQFDIGSSWTLSMNILGGVVSVK